MTRDEMVDVLVASDIDTITADILQGDTSVLNQILRGRGWMQYDNMKFKQIEAEYHSRFGGTK